MKAAVVTSLDKLPRYGNYADPVLQESREMLFEVLAPGRHHLTRGHPAMGAFLQAQASLHSGPQRVIPQRNALTAHHDLIAAQADQAQAWVHLYRSLGGGWNADPSVTDKLAAQP